jgi:DNA polymerase-3 subunit delta'
MADAIDEVGAGASPPKHPGARYFWHDRVWSALVRDFSTLPHALLLHGMNGVGKSALAWRLAKSLLCEAPAADALACGTCPSCVRFEAGTHPDVKSVVPLGDSAVIGVDQIREVGQFCTLTPHTAKRKIVVVVPADAMNTSAANAFLKVLEEPPASCFLLLVTARTARLPATIRSRCVSVSVQPPRHEEAGAWLQTMAADKRSADAALNLAGGAPLRALELIQTDELRSHGDWIEDAVAIRAGTKDPLGCARQWKDYGAERCLIWFQRYVAELVSQLVADFGNSEKRILLRELFHYSDVLSDARNLSTGPLDESLLLEDMAIRWSRLFHPVV